jgi:hypothetical protein
MATNAPFLADYIRALNEGFDSNVSYCGEPPSSAAWKALVWTEGWPNSPQNLAESK